MFKNLTRTQWTWIVGTILVLAVVGNLLPKSTKASAPSEKIDKRISVGILVLGSSTGKPQEVQPKMVGKVFELSLGVVVADPVEAKGQWRVLIGTENPIRIGACACVFDKKPDVQVGQMVKVLGTYDHAEDMDYAGRTVRVLIFKDCSIK